MCTISIDEAIRCVIVKRNKRTAWQLSIDQQDQAAAQATPGALESAQAAEVESGSWFLQCCGLQQRNDGGQDIKGTYDPPFSANVQKKVDAPVTDCGVKWCGNGTTCKIHPYLNNVVLFKGGEHNVKERKLEGDTYSYKIGEEWVAQDKLEIKPDEELVFEEDAHRHAMDTRVRAVNK